MTDRPFADGGDPAVAPGPGYYPDPSIPGFVRYWGGSAWVPGTSRLAPAEGEVLVPPRYATRRSGAAVPPARAVPPPVVPAVAAPGSGPEAVAVPEAVSEPEAVSGPEPEPEAEAGSGQRPETLMPAGGGDTGPVYFDQTSGGASFVFGPRVAEVIGGPVFRTVGSVAEPVSGESGESGWQADPRAQRGLAETGDVPRWVSWGVLPGAPEAEEGRAEPERAAVAVEVAAAAAPAMAVAVRETSAASAPSSGSVASATASGSVAAVSPTPLVEASGAVPVVKAEPAAVAPTTPMPAVPRPAREATVRRRPAASAPAAVPAGLGRRLAARVVDTLVLLVVAVAAGIPLGRSVSDHLQEKLDQARMASALTRRQVQVWLVDDVVLGKIAVLIGILLFAGLLYEVLPIARTGQTFGKRLVGIRVVDATAPTARGRLSLGRSLLRWAVRQLGTVLLLGLVWPVADRPARRGWQDRAARTRVVRG
ncbi:RDD family protein [Streptomyces sp. 1331.2]|uniref:RDD family protein n=1 Tax=Streptomyces sp. 1331.2 TaxID=1938835 RepID=UPI000BD218F0|nr:RDD family protein [Streptomyces sp. 1331.2]SOB83902.1 Uncharacterized membrane protein YckC, RDD family [Streptomyces sp. 1331.2]